MGYAFLELSIDRLHAIELLLHLSFSLRFQAQGGCAAFQRYRDLKEPLEAGKHFKKREMFDVMTNQPFILSLHRFRQVSRALRALEQESPGKVKTVIGHIGACPVDD